MSGLELLDWMWRIMPEQGSRVVLISDEVARLRAECIRYDTPQLERPFGRAELMQVLEELVPVRVKLVPAHG